MSGADQARRGQKKRREEEEEEAISETTMTTVGLSAGAAIVFVFVLLALVLFIRQRKKRIREAKKETSDLNPVYATYEVHDDPVAEVRTHTPFQNSNPMSKETNPVFFQVIDLNLDYGVVYEGEGMSKTTDVNPDYDD